MSVFTAVFIEFRIEYFMTCQIFIFFTTVVCVYIVYINNYYVNYTCKSR